MDDRPQYGPWIDGFGGGGIQSTGELLWEQRDRDWDTKQQLIIADGLIFGLTKAGELVMAEANCHWPHGLPSAIIADAKGRA